VGLEAHRVHRSRRRRVDGVDARGAAGGQVGIDRSRVRPEVRRLVELEGVDEDGDDDDVRVSGGDREEREVSVVQRPHRRDHRDPSSVDPNGLRPGAHRVRGVEDVHGAEPIRWSRPVGPRSPGARAHVAIGGCRTDGRRRDDGIGARSLEHAGTGRAQAVESHGARRLATDQPGARGSSGSTCRPVASANIVSPSVRPCAGRTALASPSWTDIASRCASGRVSSASVATTPIVVLSGSSRGGDTIAATAARSSRVGRRSPGIAVHGDPVAGSIGEPAAFTTASAATVTAVPSRSTTTDAIPTPPWSPPARAPVPAPTAPRPARRRAFRMARSPNSGPGRRPKSPPRPRSKTTAVGTTGTTWPGSGPTGTPSCRRSSSAITPSAVANP
jgi:hypothetical protein